LRQGCFGALKKRYLSGSENRILCRKSDYFPISKNLFFSSPRRSKLRQGCSGALKKRYLSGSEKLLFQVAKTLEIASKLFRRPQKVSKKSPY